MSETIEKRFLAAKEQYQSMGVDVDAALKKIKGVSISMHCWQGDDVNGFESSDGITGGGIMATGNYMGRARNIGELMGDLEKVYSLLPGNHRLNLHAMYLDNQGQNIDRKDIQPKHFAAWAEWAKQNKVGMDFNPSCFSHEKANDGFTLSSQDKGIRDYWIEHCIASRKIGEYFGKELDNPCVNNIWIPDGYKDVPVDRKGPRERLEASLDTILAADVDKKYNLDAVECKLFGIGSESYVVGSHEFYMGYAIKNQTLLCLDAGHFHPTETIADKISSVLMYVPEILLHVSRGVRWDSDHVIMLNDDLRAIGEELVRGDYLDRVHIGLDFFDASINRIAAWTIGTRNALKTLLSAMLEPIDQLRSAENEGDYTTRLALIEESKTLPFGAVWDYYCEQEGVPVGMDFMKEIKSYESTVLASR